MKISIIILSTIITFGTMANERSCEIYTLRNYNPTFRSLGEYLTDLLLNKNYNPISMISISYPWSSATSEIKSVQENNLEPGDKFVISESYPTQSYRYGQTSCEVTIVEKEVLSLTPYKSKILFNKKEYIDQSFFIRGSARDLCKKAMKKIMIGFPSCE